MGVVARQSVLNLGWILLGMAIGYLNAGYLFPRLLDVPEYGMTRLIVSWGSFALLVVGAGMPAVVLRYVPLWKRQGASAIMGVALTYPLLITLLFSFPILVFWPRVAAYYEDGTGLFLRYGLWIVPYTLLTAYLTVFVALQRLRLRTASATFWQEVGARLPNTLVILAYAAGWIDLDRFFALFALVPLVGIMGLWRSMDPPIRWSWPWKKLSWPQWKELFSYNIYAALTGLPSMLFRHVDMILVGKLLSLAKAGIYGLTILFSILVEMPSKAINPVVTSLMSYHLADRRWSEARSLLHRTLRTAFLLSIGMALLMTVNMPWVLALIKPAYKAAYAVFLWLLFVPLFRVLYMPVMTILSFSPAYRWQTIVNMVGVVINILLDLWMIPRWGLRGAAAASVVAALLNFLFLWRIGMWKMPQVVSWPRQSWKWLITGMLALGSLQVWARYGSVYEWHWIALGNVMVAIYALLSWRLDPEIVQLLPWRRR